MKIENERTRSEYPTDEFFQEIRPILYVFLTLIKSPFKISQGKLVKTNLVSFWTIIWLSFFALECYLYGELFVDFYHRFQTPKIFVSNVKLAINSLYALTHLFLTPLTNLFECNKLTVYVNDWIIFQEQFFLCTGKRFEPLCKKFVYPSIAFIALITIFVVYAEETATFYKNWYHVLLYYQNFCSNCCSFLYWSVCISEMKNGAGQVKEIILKLRERPASTLVPHELGKVRKLWIKLAKLFSNFGPSVSYTMVVWLFFNCVLFVSSFYVFTASIFFLEGNIEFGFIFFSILSLSIITFLAETSHQATKKVRDEIHSALLGFNTIEMDQNVYQEYHSFLQIVKGMDSNLSLCGFITVDRAVITSMMKNSVMYIVVLTQLANLK